MASARESAWMAHVCWLLWVQQLTTLKLDVLWKTVSQRHSHTWVPSAQDLELEKCANVFWMFSCWAFLFFRKYLPFYYSSFQKKHSELQASFYSDPVQSLVQTRQQISRRRNILLKLTEQVCKKIAYSNWYEKYFCGKYFLFVWSTYFSVSENTEYFNPLDGKG